jgi:hypothetical protein
MEAHRTAGGMGRALARRCRVALVLLAVAAAVLLDGWSNHQEQEFRQLLRQQRGEVAR